MLAELLLFLVQYLQGKTRRLDQELLIFIHGFYFVVNSKAYNLPDSAEAKEEDPGFSD